MKEMIWKFWALITFDKPISKSQTEFRFQQLLGNLEEQTGAVEISSLHHELIYEYWYNYVIKHFISLFLTSVIISSLLISKISLPAITMTSIIFFSGFYIFYYRVIFHHIFIRDLNSIERNFDDDYKNYLCKCRQAQLPNFTLVLIECVS